MQAGAQADSTSKIGLTEYWQEFKVKLRALYFKAYPAGVVLSKDVQALFATVPRKEQEALVAAFKPSDEDELTTSLAAMTVTGGKTEVQVGVGGAGAASAAATEEIDTLFIRNLLISMRMALIGEELEGLSFSLPVRALTLEKTPKLFGDSELPTINSPLSYELAEIFFEHGQIFANGRVESKVAAVRPVLSTKIAYAREQSTVLAAAMKKYQADSSPLAKRKQSLSEALQTEGLCWLNRFEQVFMQRVLGLKQICQPNTKPESDPSAQQSHLGWLFNKVTAPITYPLTATAEYLLGSGAQEETQEPELPVELAWIRGKVQEYELQIQQLSHLISSTEILDEFVPVVDSQAGAGAGAPEPVAGTLPQQIAPQAMVVRGPAHEHHAKLNPIMLCKHYRQILTCIQSHYDALSDLVQQFESLDKFTTSYFKLCDKSHAALCALLTDNPFEQQEGLNQELARQCEFLGQPQKIKQSFFDHFQGHFDNPSAIQALIMAISKPVGEGAQAGGAAKPRGPFDRLVNKFRPKKP